MNQVKHAHSVLGFVALQMSDEMPGDVIVVECIELITGLLNIIFTEYIRTGFNGTTDHLGRNRFTDGHQANFIRIAPAGMRGCSYPFLDG